MTPGAVAADRDLRSEDAAAPLTAGVRLAGRRVLVISPRFFGYESRIAEHLRARGARVAWMDERPGNSAAEKILTRLSARLMSPFARMHYRRSLRALGEQHFDDILVINPESCTPGIVASLRRSHPGARLVLYMWDSFLNKKRSDVGGFVRLFDRALTFDLDDAAEHDMVFRPLFYTPEARREPGAESTYAFSFVGTIHSDRFRVLRSLCREADLARIPYFVYPYLPSHILYWGYRGTRPEFRGTRPADFHYRPLPYAAVLRVFDASIAIVDVEHPQQRGLTMRTFEALGAGRKLVTTNRQIARYPFYAPDRIQILERDAPRIDPEFFRSPPAPLPESFASRYSLRSWIEDVFR